MYGFAVEEILYRQPPGHAQERFMPDWKFVLIPRASVLTGTFSTVTKADDFLRITAVSYPGITG